jgi:hypothetical protein
MHKVQVPRRGSGDVISPPLVPPRSSLLSRCTRYLSNRNRNLHYLHLHLAYKHQEGKEINSTKLKFLTRCLGGMGMASLGILSILSVLVHSLPVCYSTWEEQIRTHRRR